MDSFQAKMIEAGQVFTPGAPVNDDDLFAGRLDQLSKIVGAVSQRGFHAVLFGERGVGKTSLANILAERLKRIFLIAKVNCDAGDDFSSIWRKALRDITIEDRQQGIGFNAEFTTTRSPVSNLLPGIVTPDDVRRLLTSLGGNRTVLVILDEFDRLSSNNQTAMAISDTIKGLSDFGVNASVLLIGVAESIDELVVGHKSIERALVQIPMPRMSDDELEQIFQKGMKRLGMAMDPMAESYLISLSQGLPYIAHLLALHSTRAALMDRSLTVSRDHANKGIEFSLEQWQESIKTAHYDAVKSQQPGAIYRQVLLACALAQVDDRGYFTAAAVRAPLSKILNRQIDIPNFARHLKEFSEAGRGRIITRVGAARKLRYRFVSPLMRPYIIMRGYSDKLLS
jgi:Cdc6-like AAA superfamily ATPase